MEAIRASDPFVFLISPHSVEDGAYTRTELRFARDTWPNPAGQVLPIMATPTDFLKVPNYLKAVTILCSEGNLPAEVAAIVNDMAAGRTPEDTIFGQLELVKWAARESKELRHDLQLAKIDQAWEIEKKQYAVKVGDKEVMPSMRVIVEQGFSFVAMALFGYIFLSGFGWWPVLAPVIVGLLVAGYF